MPEKPSKREAEARAAAQFVAGTPLNQTAGSLEGMVPLGIHLSAIMPAAPLLASNKSALPFGISTFTVARVVGPFGTVAP